MVKKMLINAVHPEECRAAVVCDGILEELDVQVKNREATLGNVYKATINRVEPSLQAVFVDYGASRNGFLSITDVHPSYFPESCHETRRRPRIEEVFKKGDQVIVQVTKEERDRKGACVTTNLSLPGRYLVLMPGTDLHGVSRKIEDEAARKKLREISKQFKLPDNMGVIIRTAGVGRTKTELSRDLTYLLKLWSSIEKEISEGPSPILLYREQDVVIRSIRDHFSPDISEILVDDKAVYEKAKEFFQQVMPRYKTLVKHYQEKRPLFNKYQLEEQVEQVHSKRINLKSGGYIIIEPTEAVVTIDVNSGGATKERGVEETAFRVNMEAAPEIARQLRLRDLGGIIIIDFIDMVNKNHKQDVEKALKTEMKRDRAKNKVLRISALGVLELSRQRLKSSLGTGEYLDCPNCRGLGKIRTPETSALSVFRKIKSLLIKSDVREVKASVPPKVAEYLLNNMRAELVLIESQYSGRVTIQTDAFKPANDIVVESVKEEAHEPEPVEVEAAGPPELQVETENGIQEGEKKKSRKPGRRRRRSRRKTQPLLEPEDQYREPEEALLLADQETDETDAYLEPSEEPERLQADKEAPRLEPDEMEPTRMSARQAADTEPEPSQPAQDAPQELKTEEPSEKEETRKDSSAKKRGFSLKFFLPFS